MTALARGWVRRNLRRLAVGAVIAVGVLASIATSGSAVSTTFTGAIQVSAAELDERYMQSARICPNWDEFSDWPDPEPVVFELEIWFRGDLPTEIPLSLRLENAEHGLEDLLTTPLETLQLRLEIPAEEALSWVECSPWALVSIGPRAPGATAVDVIWRLTVKARVETHGVTLPGQKSGPDAYLELKGGS